MGCGRRLVKEDAVLGAYRRLADHQLLAGSSRPGDASGNDDAAGAIGWASLPLQLRRPIFAVLLPLLSTTVISKQRGAAMGGVRRRDWQCLYVVYAVKGGPVDNRSSGAASSALICLSVTIVDKCILFCKELGVACRGALVDFGLQNSVPVLVGSGTLAWG